MKLTARQPDGATLGDHLRAAAQAGAPPDPALTKECPPWARSLWQAFGDLSAARPAGLGCSGIAPSEVMSWQQLHRVRFTPWEVETLMAMDRAALTVLAAQQPRKH